ncbi:hypothetical protein FALBO_12979 [Fusarium albosuccineum]|uniref:Uncharacterized protein n=1 Tax=Fusarium albosuccineum TaxID=1237068 RepID=A0A8H4L243_9HYPO|nr:hypothetical protein FALBO_12979 [Fusarium albosuccineum]
MPFDEVYENPWTRAPVLKLDAAVILIDTFLKLLPHFPTDANGDILDEALVYSEWRYINYIRFLDINGFAPIDYPPSWDVALIWYLHILSPVRFYHYMWDSRTRAEHIVFGLHHRHFPLTKLVSGEWCPKRTQQAWDKWNSPHDSRSGGPNLPYQLWPSPPWEVKSQPGVFSQLLRRNASQEPSSSRKWFIKEESARGQEQLRQPILMHRWNRCRTSFRNKDYQIWDLSSYTQIRTGRREERCWSQSQHEERHEGCQLRPWPYIQDLREDLNRQVSFWRVCTHIANSNPGFTQSLASATNDYESFIRFFHGIRRRSKTVGQYASRLDPKVKAQYRIEEAVKDPSELRECRILRYLPPTLEVDLLWHTHRLFPGKYWVWTGVLADWILDTVPIANVNAATVLMGHTRNEWKKVVGSECPASHALDEWFSEYIPDAATFAPDDAEKEHYHNIILGHNAARKRRQVRRNRSGADASNAGGGGAGDYGGAGGGDGGGGGGGGGGE